MIMELKPCEESSLAWIAKNEESQSLGGFLIICSSCWEFSKKSLYINQENKRGWKCLPGKGISPAHPTLARVSGNCQCQDDLFPDFRPAWCDPQWNWGWAISSLLFHFGLLALAPSTWNYCGSYCALVVVFKALSCLFVISLDLTPWRWWNRHMLHTNIGPCGSSFTQDPMGRSVTTWL